MGRHTQIIWIYLFLLLLPIFIFFSPVWFKGKLPIPADTIVGMYHPFRDMVWKGFTAGVPFKNFLITDAVRQQYPWRELAISLLQQGQYPGWNPYTHAGTPLAANIQTALFYPLNILFFIIPFNTAWTIQVILQPVLLGLFMFVYLVNIGISKKSSSIASLAISFSGFSVAWLEWNTTLHTLVWLPLALLSLDKIIKKGKIRWFLTLIFSLVSIFFAGFLQTAIYAYLVIGMYALFRVCKTSETGGVKGTLLMKLGIAALLTLLITSIQWVPAAKLINLSARNIDQGNVLEREDWFLPWQHLVQFIAPDFFGNPSTLNYWGVFNYMEFIGYIGIVPLAFALSALLSHSKGKSFPENFFASALVLSLVSASPNLLSRIPYQLRLPLVSTAQPSRLIMVIDLCLGVLAAFGLDRFFRNLKEKNKQLDRILYFVLLMIASAIAGLWIFTFQKTESITVTNLEVAKRNLILPTMLFLASVGVIFTPSLIEKFKRLKERGSSAKTIVFVLLFILTSADLLRFAWKFTPFSDRDFLYPPTETIRFLKQDKSLWRYITADASVFPPNFSIPYRLQTLEGYDPIYIARYGQLIASAQAGEPILESTPFHRIIRPDNYMSQVYDLLNVKYVLSLVDLSHPKLKKVFQEGETRVYRNNLAFPRAFLIPNYIAPKSDTEALEQVFAIKKADIEESATILEYRENTVIILVDSQTGGMLVLADTYYPGWIATLDNMPIEINQVLYSLRGTMVPSGKHEILYRYSEL